MNDKYKDIDTKKEGSTIETPWTSSDPRSKINTETKEKEEETEKE
mgnify:CR=1 FL=1